MNKLLKRISIFVLLVVLTYFLVPYFPVYAAKDYSIIRVLISINNSTVPITINGVYSISEDPSISLANGNYFISVTSDNRVRILGPNVDKIVGNSLTFVRHSEDSILTVRGTDHGDVPYLGNIRFTVNTQTKNLRVVNHVPLEQYLYGVVAYEMGNSFPLEALKAQAVAARGYAIKKIMSASSSSDFDILDTPQHQVYRGYNPAFGRVIQAVNETKGQVLTYNGVIIDTFYSASNGGQTELPGNAWGGGSSVNASLPYLVQKDDPYDLENPQSIYHRFYVPKQVEDSEHKAISLPGDSAVIVVKTNSNVNIRSGPGTNHSILGTAPLYSAFQWIDTLQNEIGQTWHKILYQGKEAYISGTLSLVIPNGKYLYANPVLYDLQKQAFIELEKLGIPIEKANDIKIISVNNLENGLERWPGTGSRNYVTANANITIQYELETVEQRDLDVSIQLMIPAGNGFTNEHPYLSSNTRMRGVEQTEGGFYITAGRFGHGVGMSQRGAQQMAAAHNKTYDQILAFYFVGTTLTHLNTDVPPLPPKPGDGSGAIDPSEQLTKIISFSIPNQIGNTIIDNENNTVSIKMPAKTDLTKLIASFQLSEGAKAEVNNVLQESGKTINDFSKPVIYKVTGIDGSIREWTVYLHKFGDVNGDGNVNVSDAIIILRYIVGDYPKSDLLYKVGDVNGDGRIDVSDAILILQKTVGSIEKFPVE
ncbi:SpoIID/LytB domain-containing protein [Anaerobranca gottschalkii]|uniref:SpoIID/LytB domain protein n=1 Tax=Anaerobranca gottschalkii DSM 13577 TaxID=1120990 RepID=A0A1H9ZL27_9FIRM|nr:SpoIID/LytB domain-containing protein [Anaerobranca gottschalkii]SES82339.1 SpoIID/LytB domain protein [Anaerobranca gottschalkii DSM 13577]